MYYVILNVAVSAIGDVHLRCRPEEGGEGTIVFHQHRVSHILSTLNVMYTGELEGLIFWYDHEADLISLHDPNFHNDSSRLMKFGNKVEAELVPPKTLDDLMEGDEEIE